MAFGENFLADTAGGQASKIGSILPAREANHSAKFDSALLNE